MRWSMPTRCEFLIGALGAALAGVPGHHPLKLDKPGAFRASVPSTERIKCDFDTPACRSSARCGLRLARVVERTEARKSETPRSADIREGLVILERKEALEN